MLYTSELTAVKKLLQDYSSYNLTSAGFDTLLDEAAIDAEYWMKKYLSVAYYERVKAKNNVGLSDSEGVLVRAEIYAIAANFLYLYESTTNSSELATQASVADVSIGGGSGKETGTTKSYSNYMRKANDYMMMCRINTTKIISNNPRATEYSTSALGTVDYYGTNLPWPDEYK